MFNPVLSRIKDRDLFLQPVHELLLLLRNTDTVYDRYRIKVLFALHIRYRKRLQKKCFRKRHIHFFKLACLLL